VQQEVRCSVHEVLKASRGTQIRKTLGSALEGGYPVADAEQYHATMAAARISRQYATGRRHRLSAPHRSRRGYAWLAGSTRKFFCRTHPVTAVQVRSGRLTHANATGGLQVQFS
jgi:alpha-D-ribose 1-methylphosphonate 5-triphosphate synthase subunit PhnI